MKIIGGKLKGSTLYITKDKTTRPLKNIARESIFNLLIHSKKISFKFEEAVILDLYSGTGSFGLECLSRQVKKVFFVEKDNYAIKILEKNIDKLKLKNKSEIYFNDVYQVIGKQNVFNYKFDLIFCDPPFKDLDLKKLIQLIADKKAKGPVRKKYFKRKN